MIGGVSASAGSSRVATGSLSPAGFFKSDAPEELRYEAEKLADNGQGAKAASWRTQYQREKIEVAADTQEEPTLDAADAQEEPALDLNQSEENEATADAHMVGSRRSTLLYGDCNEHEMIEGRPVYESTKVSEALADASGGSGTEGGDSGERLHFNIGAWRHWLRAGLEEQRSASRKVPAPEFASLPALRAPGCRLTASSLR